MIDSEMLSELARLIKGARVLVFDFDGTLVDSNPIKWRAFGSCFADVSDRRDEILAYCRGMPHVSRVDKFRYVYEHILRQRYTPQIEADLLRRFEDETTNQIIAAPEIVGISQLLVCLGRDHMMAVLSSTPQDVLTQIIKQRGWREYFHMIQGAPINKAVWLKQLRHRMGSRREAVVFFGDTLEDAQAAEVGECVFVGVGNDGLHAKASYIVPDFTQLLEVIIGGHIGGKPMVSGWRLLRTRSSAQAHDHDL